MVEMVVELWSKAGIREGQRVECYWMVICFLRHHGDGPVCGRAQKWTLNGGVGRDD